MIPEKIYFDMDGVLADFDGGIRNLCHMEPVKQKKEENEETYRMWDSVRSIEHFYDRLEPYPDTVNIFFILKNKYKNRVEILTGIPKPKRHIENAAEDKIRWVRRILGEDVIVNIVYKEEKKNFVRSKECILIDDYSVNIEEWNSMGGTGILHINADTTKKRLEELEVL